MISRYNQHSPFPRLHNLVQGQFQLLQFLSAEGGMVEIDETFIGDDSTIKPQGVSAGAATTTRTRFLLSWIALTGVRAASWWTT